MVELRRWRAALALPGGAAAVREVVRVSRLWATEGGLDFIGEDVRGLGHPTPLPTAAGKDTVKADQGGEEMPDGHPAVIRGPSGMSGPYVYSLSKLLGILLWQLQFVGTYMKLLFL